MKFIKPILTVITFLSAVAAAAGQPSDDDPTLLFPDFEDGIIITRTGGSTSGRFNYHIVDGTVLMLIDGEVKTLSDPGEIGSLKIGDRMFIQVGTSDFYEKVKVADNRHLYIKWLGQINFKGKTGAYGQSSHTSSTREYNIVDGSRVNRAREEYEVVPKNLYYLNIDGKYRPFSNTKTLSKLFKEHKNDIIGYTETENTDFQNVDQVVKLLEHFGTTLNYR